ncbi:MAG TPA: hypothetical protein VF006_01055 [Longimicrobium sp.]
MSTHHRATHLTRIFLLAGLSLPAACDSPSISGSRIPAALQVVSGDLQTAEAGQPLAARLEIRVLNRSGEPAAGVEVAFEPGLGGGTLDPATSRTDAGGVASAAWTLGPAAGAQTARVMVVRHRLDTLVFTAQAMTGAPVKLIVVSGNHQEGVVADTLAEPLVARVVDAHGNGIPGIPVRWGCSGYLCKMLFDSIPTDSAGETRARWKISASAGHRTSDAWAEALGARVYFSVLAAPGPLVRIFIRPHENLIRLHPSSIRMHVETADRYGNPLFSDTAVAWSTSDSAVAVVHPDPVRRYATLSTRGAGTVQVRVRIGAVGASLPVSVRAVADPYTAVNVGLERASALNDRGEVAGYVPGGGIAVWRDGAQTLHWIPTLASDAWRTTPAMNNAGTVILHEPIQSGGPTDSGDSWLVRGGTLETHFIGRVADINDHEQVVGTRPESQESFQGFVWQAGQTVWLDAPTPWWPNTRAVAINNRGQVVVNAALGSSCTPTTCLPWETAYLWEAGRYTPLPAPSTGCVALIGRDINEAGHVLVECVKSGDTWNFLWDGAGYTRILGLSRVYGLNDRDEVVGAADDGLHLWRDGHLTLVVRFFGDFVDINNRGQILLGTTLFGGYLLTPRP